jgi:hypothetical protein
VHAAFSAIHSSDWNFDFIYHGSGTTNSKGNIARELEDIQRKNKQGLSKSNARPNPVQFLTEIILPGNLQKG